MLTYSRTNRRKKRNRIAKKKRLARCGVQLGDKLLIAARGGKYLQSSLIALEESNKVFPDICLLKNRRGGTSIMVHEDKVKDYDGVIDYYDKHIEPNIRKIQYKPLP